MAKGKHRPPSRVRYEQAHPTLSCRLDLETRELLKKRLADLGRISFATFVKDSLLQEDKRLMDTVMEWLDEAYTWHEQAETLHVALDKITEPFSRLGAPSPGSVADHLRGEGYQDIADAMEAIANYMFLQCSPGASGEVLTGGGSTPGPAGKTNSSRLTARCSGEVSAGGVCPFATF